MTQVTQVTKVTPAISAVRSRGRRQPTDGSSQGPGAKRFARKVRYSERTVFFVRSATAMVTLNDNKLLALSLVGRASILRERLTVVRGLDRTDTAKAETGTSVDETRGSRFGTDAVVVDLSVSTRPVADDTDRLVLQARREPGAERAQGARSGSHGTVPQHRSEGETDPLGIQLYGARHPREGRGALIDVLA